MGAPDHDLKGGRGNEIAEPTAKSTPRKKTPPAKTKSARTTRVRKPDPPRLTARSKKVRTGKPRGQPKWVYAFGGGKAAGRSSMRNLLGGKGAGLAEMANLGLPVPPGFTITTEV